MCPAGQSDFLGAIFDRTTFDDRGAETDIGVCGCAIWWPEDAGWIELVGWKCLAGFE